MAAPDRGTSGPPNEQSPLLLSLPQPSVPAHRRTTGSPAAISYLLLLVILAVIAADNTAAPALTRIYESIYCRQYYRLHDPSLIGRDGRDGVPEEYCKVAKIQGEVAMLKAWQTFFDSLGSLPLAIPWGYVADTHGRKPVLIMISLAFLVRSLWIQLVCYFWQTFHIKLVWLAGLHSLFGGSAVFSALAYVAVADVMPQEERVAMFFRYGAAQLFAIFISSPASALLMQFGLFVPTIVGSILWTLASALLCFLPETLNYSANTDGPIEPTEAEPTEYGSSAPAPKSGVTIRDRIRQVSAVLRDSTAFLWADSRVALLVSTYAMHTLLTNTNELLLQYISARFHVPISRATLVVSLQSALVIVHLLFVLPAVTHYLTARLHFSAQLKDLLLARYSACFMAIGFLGVGLAPTLPLLICAIPLEVAGWGFMFVTRSLVTSFVEPHHVARIYTILSLVDGAGLMLGSPGLARLFDWGLRTGGAAAGLPFIVCAMLVAAVGIVMWVIGVQDSMKGETEGLLRPENSGGHVDP